MPCVVCSFHIHAVSILQSFSTGAQADLLPPLPPSSRAAHAPHPPHHHHHHHHHHHRSNLSVCVLPPAMVQPALLRSVFFLCLVVQYNSKKNVLCCLYMCVSSKFLSGGVVSSRAESGFDIWGLWAAVYVISSQSVMCLFSVHVTVLCCH